MVSNNDYKFLELATSIAEWSTDPNTHVGAVIVSYEGDVVATGYNSFAKGVKETKERWKRPDKYNWVVHAEVNAIFEAARKGISLEGCTLYTTLFTCHTCADAIIQSGITRVCAPDYKKSNQQPHWWEDFEISKTKFEEAGVDIVLV